MKVGGVHGSAKLSDKRGNGDAKRGGSIKEGCKRRIKGGDGRTKTGIKGGGAKREGNGEMGV